MRELFQVLFEDSDLLVVNKPAGLVCHPTKTDEYSSLISRARLYLGTTVRPQLVNRLDRETSGVTVIAKNETSARQLRRQWESRTIGKEYMAAVHGHVRNESGVIDLPIGKDEVSRVAIKDCVRPDGAAARTQYRVESRFFRPAGASGGALVCDGSSSKPEELKPFTLLLLQPFTGRKHQIRIHLASMGHPIVGDKLYGGDEDLYLALVENRLTPEQRARLILPHHALHASAVTFDWDGAERRFEAEPEEWLLKFVRGH